MRNLGIALHIMGAVFIAPHMTFEWAAGLSLVCSCLGIYMLWSVDNGL